MWIHEIEAIAADGSNMTQGSIRFEEDPRKKAKARFGFDRVGRNDRTIRSLGFNRVGFIYIGGSESRGKKIDVDRI